MKEKSLKSKTGLTIKDSGRREQFTTGANRDDASGKGRFDLMPMRALARVAKLYEAGCLKYGDRNWEKGIPTHRYADSGMRHLCKFVMGMRDEDHLTAAIWNLLCLADTLERIKEGVLPENLLTLPRAIPSKELAKAAASIKRFQGECDP